MTITRFNPTANGPLHLGHAYSMLVNKAMAVENDGEFIVRYDDMSTTPRRLPRERVERIIGQQMHDIKWLLGTAPDKEVVESDIQKSVEAKLKKNGHGIMIEPLPNPPYSVRLNSQGRIHIHYIPQETAERVVRDYMYDVTHVIRGEEFITEVSLYSYYCQKWGYPIPQFFETPRLTCNGVDISKTNGGNTIGDMRGRGYSALEIREMLEHACLVNPRIGWIVYNLKPNPNINL